MSPVLPVQCCLYQSESSLLQKKPGLKSDIRSYSWRVEFSTPYKFSKSDFRNLITLNGIDLSKFKLGILISIRRFNLRIKPLSSKGNLLPRRGLLRRSGEVQFRERKGFLGDCAFMNAPRHAPDINLKPVAFL